MRTHLVAVGLLTTVGILVSLSLAGLLVEPSAGPDAFGHAIRLIGLRFFGYGALVLLGSALAIGPLARLRPKHFSRMLAYRRAVGIWSAMAAATHLVFVLLSAKTGFFRQSWTDLFIRIYRGYGTDGSLIVRIGVQHDALGTVAWSGLIAFLLLGLVALVSNNAAQRRLGQAAWKLIQQWSYTAFLFVALHVGVMATPGGKFKASPPLMRWSLWFLAGVALLQMAGFIYTVWRRRPASE